MAQKLFVGNLPHSVTDSAFNDFVVSAGFQVASAVVIRDKLTGQSRGFGFVELADGADLQKAIEGLNGQTLEGRRLTVNEARPMRTDSPRPRGGGGGGGGGGRGRYEHRRRF
jgi:RNA recognition motif-containing protein